MLQVQVQYWDMIERKRHNLVSEAQEGRKVTVQEKEQSETARHNLANENLGWFNAQENQRHNLVGENISWATYGETVRHNQEQESIGRTQAQASVTQAQASVMQAQAAQSQAATAARRADIDAFRAGVEASETDTRKQLNLAKTETEQWNAQRTAAQAQSANQDVSWRSYDELVKGIQSVMPKVSIRR